MFRLVITPSTDQIVVLVSFILIEHTFKLESLSHTRGHKHARTHARTHSNIAFCVGMNEWAASACSLYYHLDVITNEMWKLLRGYFRRPFKPLTLQREKSKHFHSFVDKSNYICEIKSKENFEKINLSMNNFPLILL